MDNSFDGLLLVLVKEPMIQTTSVQKNLSRSINDTLSE